VNDNYFRIEPPPHLQQFWTGNVYSDSSNYNITLWMRGWFGGKQADEQVLTDEPVFYG